MEDSKECIMCFSEIDSRAKKCPKCLSVQNKSSNLESNQFIMVVLGLITAGIIGSLFYDHFYPRIMEDEVIRGLKVSVSESSISKEGDTLYAACLGTIDNKSNFKFKDVKFEVSFLSNDGSLIDTFPIKDKNLTIIPNNLTNFRVRGVAQKKKEFYNNCTVKIADAWAM